MILELIQVALECGGEEWDDVQESPGVEGVEVAGLGRGELHEPNQLVVDVERVEKETTVPVLLQVVFVAGAQLRRPQVLNDDGVRALEDSRIAGVGSVRAGGSAIVAEQKAFAHRSRSLDRFDVGPPVEGDQPEAELRAPQEISDPMLQALDLLG